jgi:hypothetical protein
MELASQKSATKKVLGILKSMGVFLFVLSAHSASAYALLEPISGVTSVDTRASGAVGSYLSNIYVLGIGLAGVLAVLMIVVGGIQYIGSGMSPSGKSDAKDRITNAVLGLLLALLSWLILNTIDPNLVSLRF